MKKFTLSFIALVLLVIAVIAILPQESVSQNPYTRFLYIRDVLRVYGNTALDTTMINTAANVSNRLTLPKGTFFTFSGSTRVTSIVPSGIQGRVVTFYNPAATYLDTLVDGGNLKLASNFNGTADDMITLVQVDTFWVELSRSAN